MKKKRARLIYNPTSGREEIKRRLPDILQRLDQGGIETSCYATMGPGDATLEATRVCSEDYDMVFAAGGDGTLYEIINGMAQCEYRPPLGVFPVGTTNDFARGLGIPMNWKMYCDLVLRQRAYSVDVGKANDQYFINIAAGGFLTELTYEVPSRLKTMLGQLAYYIKGIEKMVRLFPQELIIKSRGRDEIHDQFMLFLIANTNCVGGFERLFSEACIDDGKFDVLAIRKCNLAEMMLLVTMAIRGEPLHDKRVIRFQTDEMEVWSPGRVQLNLDGELGGELPAKFSNLQHHIMIYC